MLNHLTIQKSLSSLFIRLISPGKWCKIVQTRVTSMKFGTMIGLCALRNSGYGATPNHEYVRIYSLGINYLSENKKEQFLLMQNDDIKYIDSMRYA